MARTWRGGAAKVDMRLIVVSNRSCRNVDLAQQLPRRAIPARSNQPSRRGFETEEKASGKSDVVPVRCVCRWMLLVMRKAGPKGGWRRKTPAIYFWLSH